jgi:hypothetical protein
MTTALVLLVVQGVLGAFDTLWYHEFRQQLPRRAAASLELRLHAARDFAYAVLFGSLAWVAWHGWLAWLLAALLAFEITITLWDFIEEDISRPLPPGERVMHTIMAIVYGGFLAYLVPVLFAWSAEPTGFARASHGWISWLMTAMAVGVFGSGVRDLAASFSPRCERN